MWYLCVFFHRLLDYRKSEVESLAELFEAFMDNQDSEFSFQNRSSEWKFALHHHPDSPFKSIFFRKKLPQTLPIEVYLGTRMGMYEELWGEVGSHEELKSSELSYSDNRKLSHSDSNCTFKITDDSFKKVFSF